MRSHDFCCLKAARDGGSGSGDKASGIVNLIKPAEESGI